MGELKKFVEKEGYKICDESSKYCKIGQTLCFNNEEYQGIYWFYETDLFFIDIHDFFVKKERINTSLSGMSNFLNFYSSYLITASGESFNPYQTLSAHSLYVVDTNLVKNNYKFLLHANFPYLSVGINFKEEMINEQLSSHMCKKDINLSEMFYNTRTVISKSLENLAKSIINCKMTTPAAEIFFEAKAKEWLSITIDAFLNASSNPIPKDDELALENVANYLDDHYALDISQEILEHISMMSGTKLKKLFKQKYQLSISEYSQRRRMNIAEILLLNSNLKIKDIAESVGYSSHSKFTACFKKHKGIYPSEIKKMALNNVSNLENSCEKPNCENIISDYDHKI